MYILFVELLKQLPQTEYAKHVMLDKCRDYYRRNQSELKKIEQFRKKYKSDQAINWYTCDSFVYRLVNQAFRTEDITLWFLIRFYIVDGLSIVEQTHYDGVMTVYRGQSQFPLKEFEYMQHNINSLFATNAFWSTSKSLGVALQYVKDATDTDDYKVVLFEITVDQTRFKNLVFVDIDEWRKRESENEILFTIGSVFKLKSIERDDQLNLWKICMSATDESMEQLKVQIKLMKLKYQYENNTNLLFGRFLLDFGHYSKAESYFQLMLQLDNEVTSSVYDYLGNLYMSTTNWYEAYKNFSLSLKMKSTNSFSFYFRQDFGITYIGLGNYYKAIEDLGLAYKYYREALRCWNSENDDDQINIAVTKLNLASVYLTDYKAAIDLCLEAREVLEKHKYEPRPYAEIIYCHYLVGNIHCRQLDYYTAEDFYEAAFKMSEKFLPIGSYHRIRCINALSELYQKKDENNMRSLRFCNGQLELHENYLPESHLSIAHLLMIIGDLLTPSMHEDKLNFY
ncbi:unnamed protein product [Didymodactylos carnosus]|uniref:Mono(ADP-ribosyl)transferase n=1 Tax=Didymodactylos carnosus TaxID=1234261 RepID=A0A815S018_9BILA|nr:unnamed protein product [Didymodactylos carnosus]CAF1481733.1 unnamed protein product [Didymodactylos carnosus]CAF4170148.1 unnamed protein product [Didymodactylos carnosus]CAF4346612.1 unnamed protein product [Didymodactylos carnosus]